MSTKAERQLEIDAMWAYVTGTTWSDYWNAYADAIRAVEPYNFRSIPGLGGL